MKLYRSYRAGDVEASPEDIIAAFNDLPLPVRLLALADTADAANARLMDEGATPGLATDAYRRLGSRWEREDAEKAQRNQEVEELAQVLYAGNPFSQKIIGELHYPRENSVSAMYPDPLCNCDADWPCETARLIYREDEL